MHLKNNIYPALYCAVTAFFTSELLDFISLTHFLEHKRFPALALIKPQPGNPKIKIEFDIRWSEWSSNINSCRNLHCNDLYSWVDRWYAVPSFPFCSQLHYHANSSHSQPHNIGSDPSRPITGVLFGKSYRDTKQKMPAWSTVKENIRTYLQTD